MTTSPRIDTALFALGFLLAGLVLLALVWSGARPYEDLARANRVEQVLFIDQRDGTAAPVALPGLVSLHAGWSAYVTGATTELPLTFGREFWTAEELSHMADVRRVFDGAKLLVPAGLFLMAFRLQRARMRGLAQMLYIARAGALIALIAVALVGVVAAFAFDPLFLLFHYVFFPQGNFLFDPRTSNLVRLYPDWYWEGITVRIGLSFVALAAAVFVASALGLRRARASRLANR